VIAGMNTEKDLFTITAKDSSQTEKEGGAHIGKKELSY
jgi:hypothetical protein